MYRVTTESFLSLVPCIGKLMDQICQEDLIVLNLLEIKTCFFPDLPAGFLQVCRSRSLIIFIIMRLCTFIGSSLSEIAISEDFSLQKN